MNTKITVEITGKTASWIKCLSDDDTEWSTNGLISHILYQAEKLADAGRLVLPNHKVPSIAGYDVQTKVETIAFEVGEMVNIEHQYEEAWLTGMVLGVNELGVEVQLTAESAKMWDGASRDIWSPESLRPVK